MTKKIEGIVIVSIITINYNNADGLQETLDSVRSQTFTEYEHIIVDGASSDGSVDVIREALKDKKYASHVSWWCSEKDGGIYDAMNKGIKRANGKFVFMLNSGDCFSGKKVLSLIEESLRENDGCIVYGAVDYYDKDGYLYTCSTSQNDLLRDKNIPHQACFISRNLHEKIGLYDCSYKIYADFDFMIKSYKAGVNFVHVPLVISDCDLVGASSNVGLQKKEFLILKKRYYPKENVLCKRAVIFLKFLLPGFAIEFLKLFRRKEAV